MARHSHVASAVGPGDRDDALIRNAARDERHRWPVHDIRVRRHPTADDAVSEAPVRVDDDLPGASVNRIGAEDDRRNVGRNQLLNQNRQAHAVGVNPVLTAVFERSRRACRRATATDRSGDRLFTSDVQVRVVNAGERRGGGVLFDRGGTHGDGRIRHPTQLGEPVVGVGEFVEQSRQCRMLGGILVTAQATSSGVCNKVRRQTEAGRDAISGGSQTAQLCGLPANERAVVARRISEPHDVHGRKSSQCGEPGLYRST